MIHRVLTSEMADALGYSFAGVALWIKSLEWLNIKDISLFWDFVLAVGTGFFLFYKGYNAMLDSKGKKLDNQLKQRELNRQLKSDENEENDKVD